MKGRRRAAALLGGACLDFLLAVWPANLQAGFQLTACSDRVSVLQRGSWRWRSSLPLPLALEPGDRVRVGANAGATLSLDEEQVMRLGARSEVVINPGETLGQVLELRSGSMSGMVSLAHTEGFSVLTSAGAFFPEWGKYVIGLKAGRKVRIRVQEGALQIKTPLGRYRVSGTSRPVWIVPGKPPSPDSEVTRLSEDMRPPVLRGPRVAEALAPVLPAESVPEASVGSIPELVTKLERDPGNSKLREALNRSVGRLAARWPTVDPVLPAGERWGMLRASYRSLIPQVEDEAVHELLQRGYQAFSDGDFLLAAERLGLCRILGPREEWVRAALSEFLDRQIPAAVESTAASLHPSLAASYRSVHRCLVRYDWRGAARELERSLTLIRGRGESTSRKLGEASALSGRLASRIAASLPEKPEDLERRVLDVLRESEQDPTGGAPTLEDMLALSPTQSREPWWQKAAEGLRRCYLNSELQGLIAQARGAHEAGSIKQATQLLVSVLQKSPGNPQALLLLDRMQQQIDSSRAAARDSRQVKAPVVEPARASARRKTARAEAAASNIPPQARALPAAPTILQQAQAEAGYRRGLKHYMKGELREALREWRQALEFNAEHEQVKKALTRGLKEMGSAPEEDKTP